MADLNLRFERGETLPKIGEDFYMQGMAGIYRVRISRIMGVRWHPEDDAILLEVKATRELINEESGIQHDPTRS